MADEKIVKKRKIETGINENVEATKLAKVNESLNNEQQSIVNSDNFNSLNFSSEEGEEDDDSMGGDDEVEDESDSDKEFINKQIEVEFAAFDPNQEDFHGIKCLLQRLWLKENVDLSQMSDLLINADTIASVLKQEGNNEEGEAEQETAQSKEEEDEKNEVYGIISLIPFNQHFLAKNCIQQIKQLLLSYIPKENGIHSRLLDDSKCALIINERFLNLPPKISTPCYTELISEVNEYKNANVDYQFDYIIMICKILKNKNNVQEVIYVNAEDELFKEAADSSFEYSVSSQCDSDIFDWNDDENLYEPYRNILLLNKQKWIETVYRLKECV